ncbi:hypothetical protein RRG08_065013 [Elysia crispata]|uniref:Uncharacterized protein n=1 Tax=Elysia crispata TaxID=231223 RepID=A0AAE1CWX2_9GAST|nr:hypothetical protein RRG08_065013 [Elysia crispata]
MAEVEKRGKRKLAPLRMSLGPSGSCHGAGCHEQSGSRAEQTLRVCVCVCVSGCVHLVCFEKRLTLITLRFG